MDNQYPVFVLAFCIFHKKNYSEKIVPDLEKFKFKHFGHDQIVLHENEIRKEKGRFSLFKSREQKNDFLDELTEIIDKNNFILISCLIDKKEQKKQNGTDFNPYHIALNFCLHALYKFLVEKSENENKTHVIVECRGKREDDELELEFRRLCDDNDFPFEVIFSDKKAMSSGLQLADLVARPIGINFLRPEQDNRAFKILKNKFFCSGGRENTGIDYGELGMKVLPKPKSTKPQ